jgi:hypothetical protein
MIKKIGWLASLSVIASFFVIIGSVYMGYLYSYPHRIIEIKSLEVLDKIVHPGSFFKYKLCYAKYYPEIADVGKKLVNSTVINYPTGVGNNEVGERCDILYEWLPAYAESDTDYRFVITLVYHPTPFATKIYEKESNKFAVDKNPCYTEKKEKKEGFSFLNKKKQVK